MDKIKEYIYIKKKRTIKEITRKEIVDKLNELVEGYNEIMEDNRRMKNIEKRLEKINYMITHQHTKDK